MPIAEVTTLLFVPATRPERFAKALASGAGAVVIDLEDAVAPDERAGARDGLLESVARMTPPEQARVLVRVNAAGSRWHAADVVVAARLVSDGIAGVMLPKADSAANVTTLATALGHRAQVVPLIESLNGLDAAASLAAAPGVVRLAFGHLDLMTDLGMACGDEETELLPARFELVRASRRAGIAAPIDGVTTHVGNAENAARDAARSMRMGFGGKLCIHPDQVEPVRDAFRPSQSQLDWSRRVLTRANAGEHVFMLDGKMVDAPVIAHARRLVGKAG